MKKKITAMLISVLMLSSLIISPVWASNIGKAKTRLKMKMKL